MPPPGKVSHFHTSMQNAGWLERGRAKRDDAARDIAIWNVRKARLSTIRAIIEDGIVTMSDAVVIPLA
jgi:hypothetical protein